MQSLSENFTLTSFLVCNFLVLVNTFLLRSGASTEIFISFLSFYIEENKGDLVHSKFGNFSTEALQFD
jgi:hypothetical protein